MAIKLESYLPSSDGHTDLHLVRWIPEGAVRGCLELCHGMIDCIDRYDEMATYFADHGYAVVGHDYLGHGGTGRREDRGFFGETGGKEYVLEDVGRVADYCRGEYIDVPFFMLGHSMGSFLLRRFISVCEREPDGIILMGIGELPLPLILATRLLTGIITRLKGGRFQSPLMHRLVLGRYNRHFRPLKTSSDWLSRDEVKVAEYVANPDCDFYFTCFAYRDFLSLLLDIKSKRDFDRIPRTLPILIESGAEDPVGNFGRAPAKVVRQFQAMGFRQVSLKLYMGARHELFNEKNRQEVFCHVLAWMEDRVLRRR